MKRDVAFKYCPRCGYSKLSGGLRKDCNKCGYTFFLNPSPCVGVILTKNDEVLLCKRGIEPHKGTWDYPGGFIEVGETFEEGAIREIDEELGIEIYDLDYFNSVFDTYLYSGVVDDIIVVNLRAKTKADEFKPAHDVSEVKFFKINEIPFDQICFESVKSCLKLLQKEFISKP